MPTIADLAPTLAPFLDASAALDLAKAALPEPPPPPRKVFGDLTLKQRTDFLAWLKWYGQEKKPIIQGVPWLDHSAKQVADHLWLAFSDVRTLVLEKQQIESEVAEWGAEAFTDHPAKPPYIHLVKTDKQEVTLQGCDFLYGSLVSRVRFNRNGELLVSLRQEDVIAAGGKYTETYIAVPDTLVKVQEGDEVLVRVNNTNSNKAVVKAPADPKPIEAPTEVGLAEEPAVLVEPGK